MGEWSPLDLAPGVYVAGLGLLLAGALRRWYDPVPWRVLGAFAVVLGVLFGSVLCGGSVLLPLDNLRGEVPFRLLPPTQPHGNLLQGDLIELVVPSLDAARRGLTAGRWPLWNSRVGAGMPLLADPQAQALAPLAVLALPFSPQRGAGVIAALRVLLALVFTFLLLRRQGLGEGPSLAGALAFGLSGIVILWVGWPLASSAALLPAVLYALARLAGSPYGFSAALGQSAEEAGIATIPGEESEAAEGHLRRSRGRRRRDALLLVLALAALFLAGHPETELYACLLAAAFAAGLVRRMTPGRRLPLLRRMSGAALVAAGVAAPALLPALDYLPQTLRAERLAHPAAPMLAPPAPSPAAAGAAMAGGAAGPALPASPAASAIPGPPPTPGAQGAPAPLELPGARGGGLARRWLPILAPNAYGNSRFAAYWGSANSNEDAAGFAGTAAALGAALAAATPRRRRLPQEGLMLAVLGLCLLQVADPAWLHALLAAAAPGLAGSRRCLLLVAFCLAYLAACTWERHRRGGLRRAPLLIAAAALGALLAWAYIAHPFPGDPGRLAVLRFGWLRWQARFLLAATVLLALPGGARGARAQRVLAVAVAGGLALVVGAELLLAHVPANPPMPMRLALPRPAPLVLLTREAGSDRVAALGRGLPPNLASLYDLTDVRVYNPMAPAAYLALLAPITTGWWGEMPELGAPADFLYRRLGVRYLLVAPGQRLPPPWGLRLADPSGWVYRRIGVWPRLYATRSGIGRPLPGGLLAASFDEDEVTARAPVVDRDTELAGSLYQDGGWRLLLDGRRAPPPLPRRLLDAPLSLRAAEKAALPPGAENAAVRVNLLYRPRAFVAGMLAAALACAAAIACWAPGPPVLPGTAEAAATMAA
jgi:hypothetical protein